MTRFLRESKQSACGTRTGDENKKVVGEIYRRKAFIPRRDSETGRK